MVRIHPPQQEPAWLLIEVAVGGNNLHNTCARPHLAPGALAALGLGHRWGCPRPRLSSQPPLSASNTVTTLSKSIRVSDNARLLRLPLRFRLRVTPFAEGRIGSAELGPRRKWRRAAVWPNGRRVRARSGLVVAFGRLCPCNYRKHNRAEQDRQAEQYPNQWWDSLIVTCGTRPI